MSMRLFAVLFTALFLTGAFPILFVQPSGPASAGIAAGFTLPAQNLYHVMALMAIGVLSVWAGGEAVLVLPLCSLLMLAIGALLQIDAHAYPAVQVFIVGAIVLFALCVSLLRHKWLLTSIPPIALWMYFSGAGFMKQTPLITTPWFFLMGIIANSVLLTAIGVTLGITLADKLRESTARLKKVGALTAFLSLF